MQKEESKGKGKREGGEEGAGPGRGEGEKKIKDRDWMKHILKGALLHPRVGA